MAEDLNEKLANAFVTLQANTERLGAGEVIVVQGVLKGLEDDIVRKLQDNPDMTAWRKARYNALLSQTRKQIASTYRQIQDRSQKFLTDTANVTGKATAKIFEAVNFPLQSVAVTDEQWAAIAKSSLIQGNPAAAWWSKQDKNLQARFLEQMRIGYASGESVDQLIQRVRGTPTGKRITYLIKGKKKSVMQYHGGIMDVSRNQAAALVRTAVQQIAADARMEMLKKNADILKGVMWLATLDSRTTLLCASRSGKLYTLDGKPIGHDLSFLGGTPAHFNCYVPDENLVAPVGNAVALYRRPYEGDVLVVRCSGVSSFSVTPEHEVFTQRGWIPAKQLVQGDYLVRQILSDNGCYLSAKNIDYVKAGVQKQADPVLFMDSPVLCEMPMTAKDFNNTGSDGNVGYILADHKLFRDWNTTISKHLCQSDFLLSNSDLILGSFAFQDPLRVQSSLLLSTDCGIGRLCESFPFLRSHSGDMDAKLFRRCSEGDIECEKPVAEHSPVSIDTFGKLFGSDSCSVLIKELLKRNVVAMVGEKKATLCNDIFHSMLRKIEQQCSDLAVSKKPVGKFDLGWVWLFDVDEFADVLTEYDLDFLFVDSVKVAYFGKGNVVFVELDHVTDVSIRHYCGHVENLACDTFDNESGGNIAHNETVGNGCYFLNGFLVHNCRSTLVPVTKSFAELQEDAGLSREYLEKIGEGTQASMNGSVPDRLTFDSWFNKLPEADQKAYLGPRKWEIWKKAGLNFPDLVDQSGNPLTIEQLARAYGVKIKQAVETGIPNIPKEIVSAIAVEHEAQLLASKMMEEQASKAQKALDAIAASQDALIQQVYAQYKDDVKDLSPQEALAYMQEKITQAAQEAMKAALEVVRDVIGKHVLDGSIIKIGNKSFDMLKPKDVAEFRNFKAKHLARYRKTVLSGKKPDDVDKAVFDKLSDSERNAFAAELEKAKKSI